MWPLCWWNCLNSYDSETLDGPRLSALNFHLSENFLRKCIVTPANAFSLPFSFHFHSCHCISYKFPSCRKGIFIIKLRKRGWTEQSKVVLYLSAFWSTISCRYTVWVNFLLFSAQCHAAIWEFKHYSILILLSESCGCLSENCKLFFGTCKSAVCIKIESQIESGVTIRIWIE